MVLTAGSSSLLEGHADEIAELQAYAPGLNWEAYFTASSVPSRNRMIVLEKTAIRDIVALYAQTPLNTLKAWEAFHVAEEEAPYL